MPQLRRSALLASLAVLLVALPAGVHAAANSLADDCAPPVVTCPPPLTLECSSTTGGVTTLNATVRDTCGREMNVDWYVNGGQFLRITLPAGNIGDQVVSMSKNFTFGTSAIEVHADYGTGQVSCATSVLVSDTQPPVVRVPADVTVNCAGPAGNTVSLGSASATDLCDKFPKISNDAPLKFLPGVTIVTWRARDSKGNVGVGTQRVTVRDLAPPVITLRGANPMQVDCATPFADPGVDVSDLCSANPSLVVTGSVNAGVAGTYSLTYRATDVAGNSASVVRTVIVSDATPPVVVAPPDVIVDCGASGDARVMLGLATATDACDPAPVVSNDAPERFEPGTWTVTWRATDRAGNSATASQRVTVVDHAPPVLRLLGSDPIELACAQPFVDPGATAEDACAGPVQVQVSGSVDAGAPGSYELTYSAADPSGNVASAVRHVVVASSGPPEIVAISEPVSLDCNHAGDAVLLSVSARSACDPALGFEWRDESGRLLGNAASIEARFSPGDHVATATVSDHSGHHVSATVAVHVGSPSAPEILSISAPVSLDCKHAGDAVALAVSARSACDPALGFEWRDESGRLLGNAASIEARFSPGDHVATATVSDHSGHHVSASVAVHVARPEKPAIAFALSKNQLWPPDHKMVLVASGIGASSACDPAVACEVGVRCNEAMPASPTNGDWKVEMAADHTMSLWLRAERTGKGDRVYTVCVRARDGAGMCDSMVAQVTVSHDQGGSSPAATKGVNKNPALPASASRTLGIQSISPNPIRTSVSLRYTLPESSPVRLAVFDVIGREIRLLASGEQSAGSHEASWDGRDRNGRQVTAGLYLFRLQAGGRAVIERALIAR